jgi:hypothetical protein
MVFINSGLIEIFSIIERGDTAAFRQEGVSASPYPDRGANAAGRSPGGMDKILE